MVETEFGNWVSSAAPDERLGPDLMEIKKEVDGDWFGYSLVHRLFVNRSLTEVKMAIKADVPGRSRE